MNVKDASISKVMVAALILFRFLFIANHEIQYTLASDLRDTVKRAFQNLGLYWGPRVLNLARIIIVLLWFAWLLKVKGLQDSL